MTRQSAVHKFTTNRHKCLAVISAGIVGCAMFGTASSNLEVHDAVKCSEYSFSRSVETQDEAHFASFIDEDARFISETVLRGPAAVVEAWAQFFSDSGPRIQWRPYFVEVAASGDVAFSRGPYRISGVRENGETYESWGIYNSVWRKVGNAPWKVIFDAGNQGEDQLSEAMKNLIAEPVGNCDVQLDRKNRLG